MKTPSQWIDLFFAAEAPMKGSYTYKLWLSNFEKVQKDALSKLNEWSELSDSGLKLRCGELTAQEIRIIRAVLKAIKG